MTDIINYLDNLKIRLNKVIQNKIKINQQHLQEISNRYIFTNPITIYQTKEMQFDNLIEKLKYNTINLISNQEKKLLTIKNSYVLKKPYQLLEKKSNQYLQIISKLETLSPLLTLKRGYTMTRWNNKVITSCKSIKKEDKIEIEFQDGKINAKVL